MKTMIYTVGYQAMTTAGLEALVTALQARLIDCRYRPTSRKPGFSSGALELLLNTDTVRYVVAGVHLGGDGHVTGRGIENLRKYDGEDAQKSCILMCMENHPADCHRHRAITGPHFPGALHIMNGRVFRSNQLQDAIEGTITYDAIESMTLADWIAS